MDVFNIHSRAISKTPEVADWVNCNDFYNAVLPFIKGPKKESYHSEQKWPSPNLYAWQDLSICTAVLDVFVSWFVSSETFYRKCSIT